MIQLLVRVSETNLNEIKMVATATTEHYQSSIARYAIVAVFVHFMSVVGAM